MSAELWKLASPEEQVEKDDIFLRVQGLTTHLGADDQPVRAVDGIDLDLRRGETFALLGESGCGKSMAALSVMRLLPPSGRIISGEVELDGQSLLDLSESAMRRERGGRIGMIFQEPMTSLNPVMKVGEQITEAVRLHDAKAAERPLARALELLKLVGIPDPERRLREYPHQLSGGMKQRIMIAIALAGRPELLIADEPTTALDVTIQAQVLALLKDLQRETGMAILLITHDLGVVAETADRVAVMYAGRIVETKPVRRFFEAPQHPYSRKLFRSVPSADKRAGALEVIPGRVPALNQVFTGCRFAGRCREQLAHCADQPPPWRGEAEDGFLCHLEARELAPLAKLEAAEPVAMDRRSAALLRVRDLKVHFPIHKGLLRRTVGQVKAVDGLDLDIHAGTSLALVGESGCGKTTVGKGILQLIPPTAGSVQLEHVELTRLSAAELRAKRSDFQIIFQDPAAAMNPRMLVEDIVAEGLVAQGIGKDREQRRKKVIAALDQVGLPPEAAARYPHEFSGGQRQRICVARALAVEPKLIVCDEPTSALDVSVQAQVLNLLKDLQQRLGLAYLFITHNIAVVSYLAQEVAVMYLGRIVERGPTDRVLEHPAHPYTQALLSAAPVADIDARREVIRLQGDLPSPADPPAGCHFHPRCPRAVESCRESYPEARQLAEGHSAACHLLD